MSDFTAEYIKMCSEAEEIRKKWQFRIGDHVASYGTNNRYTYEGILVQIDERIAAQRYAYHPVLGKKSDVGVLNVSISRHDLYTKEFIFPLWSQEQLQGMLDYRNAYEFLRAFYQWLILQHDIPYSMNENLLRYVMKQLHNQRWTGEGWEGIG